MQGLRVRKLRNVPRREKVILLLLELLRQDEMHDGTWPMLEIVNRPDYPANLDKLYVLEDNGVLMPAYILVNGDEAVILWVNKSHRRKGYAKCMVETMQIKYCVAMESSVEFWKSIGFKQLNSANNGEIRMKR